MFTACQKIKFLVLNHAFKYIDDLQPVLGVKLDEVNEKNIDIIYDKLDTFDRDFVRDYEHDIRGGDEETNIDPEWSRHYSSKSVAKKMLDGSYVGWDYWYGGGKHGCPEEMLWMENAYDLVVEEKEVVRTERIFTKIIQKPE